MIKFFKNFGARLEINVFKFKTTIENKISASLLPWKPTPMFGLWDVIKKITTFERKNVETYKVAE